MDDLVKGNSTKFNNSIILKRRLFVLYFKWVIYIHSEHRCVLVCQGTKEWQHVEINE